MMLTPSYLAFLIVVELNDFIPFSTCISFRSLISCSSSWSVSLKAYMSSSAWSGIGTLFRSAILVFFFNLKGQFPSYNAKSGFFSRFSYWALSSGYHRLGIVWLGIYDTPFGVNFWLIIQRLYISSSLLILNSTHIKNLAI